MQRLKIGENSMFRSSKKGSLALVFILMAFLAVGGIVVIKTQHHVPNQPSGTPTTSNRLSINPTNGRGGLQKQEITLSPTATPMPNKNSTGLLSPPPVGTSCGTVNTGFGGDYNPSVTANPPDAETCLQQAYQQCRQATLTVINGGTDTSATHNFMLQNNQGACRITDRVSSFTLPLGQQTNTYTCAALTQQNGGLLFSGCGNEGDVFVPPPH